jgi:hypothetical protein
MSALSRFNERLRDATVDSDYIVEHTLRTQPKPIIICRDVFSGDQVVDGSHRFVAFCAGCAKWQLADAYFPAYVLQPHEWQQFVISGFCRSRMWLQQIV